MDHNIGYVGEFFIWLFGRPLPYGKVVEKETFGLKLVVAPPNYWEMAPTGDFYLTFHIPYAPNVIHRLMQRIILGIKYRRKKYA